MKRLLALALLVPALSNAETTVFGLEMGKPLTLPPCPVSKYGDVDLFNQPVTCLWNRGDKGASVVFPDKLRPAVSKSPSIKVALQDGRLQGITVYTFGLASQDYVFSKLVEKFGTPKQNVSVPSQSGAGQKFNSINAVWDTPDVVVEFWGTETKTDIGVVWIEAPEIRKARISDALKPSGTSL